MSIVYKTFVQTMTTFVYMVIYTYHINERGFL